MTVKVFYSYSHKDEELCRRLISHLSVMQREGLITGWHDRRLEAGSDWDHEIRSELEQADLILFLVSSDFMASSYCYDIEVRRALERDATGDARVVPIILREVDWEGSVFTSLMALPTDGKAVCSAHWHSQDEAFTDVARNLRKLVQKIEGRPQSNNSPAAGRAGWNTNLTHFHRRNPHFAGRESVLTNLESLLPSQGGGLATLFGLGGVGKTQTAVEFAFRRCGQALTWWLPAEEPSGLLAEYCTLAPSLGVNTRGISDLKVVARQVRIALELASNWLLVFDNVDKPTDVTEFLPSSATGSVLLTTRNPNFGVLGAMVAIEPWDRKTAAKFLTQKTKQSDVTAEVLADELGGLPLACEQAGAYIAATGISLSEYLDLFLDRRKELWSEEAQHLSELGRQVTVATVWDLSLAKVGANETGAIELLRLLSFMAAEAVPLRIISQYGQMAAGLLTLAAGKPLFLNRIVGALRRYSLIDRLDVVVRVHRLLQAVIRDGMSETLRSKWIMSATRITEAAFQFDKDDPTAWPLAREILPHAVAAAAWHVEGLSSKNAVTLAPDTNLESAAEELSRLLKKLASYFRVSAQYQAARSALDQALEVDKIRPSTDYRSLVGTTIELGQILREQGDLEGSRRAQERAIEICTSNDEFEGRQISAALLNLGQVMRAEGNVVGAIGIFRKAMAVSSKGAGKHDADLATILNHYGEALAEQGDFPEARQAFQRAFALDQANFGPAHPTLARDLLGLAKVSRLKNDLASAKRASEQALSIYEKNYQSSHPVIADALMDYAATLALDDKPAAARVKYNQANKMYESFYGTDHVKCADALYQLGLIESELGEETSAAARLVAAREIYLKRYGADHARILDITRELKSLSGNVG